MIFNVENFSQVQEHCLKFYSQNYSSTSITHSTSFYKIPIHPISNDKSTFKPVTLIDKNCSSNQGCCELFIMLNKLKAKLQHNRQQFAIGDPIIYKNFLRVC